MSYTKVPELKKAFFEFLNEKLEDTEIFDVISEWFTQNTKDEHFDGENVKGSLKSKVKNKEVIEAICVESSENQTTELIKDKLTPYNEYKKMYHKYLESDGLPLYSEKNGFGQSLAYLNTKLGNEVPIEEIKDYVIKHGITLKGGDPLQLRHVARCYNLLKGGEINPITNKKIKRSHFCLLNLTKHHPNYIPSRNTSISMSDEEWEKLKKEYKSQCASCGNIEGEPMRFNSYTITKLQRGHMDPRKEGSSDNIIPQCKDCNQQYKNKAIFNNMVE